ncbi:MAG: hypothetical protein GY739_12000 [Mesoflavibacter sp.]|nr:hypothetical protein [Mesoflavibacter sp.]
MNANFDKQCNATQRNKSLIKLLCKTNTQILAVDWQSLAFGIGHFVRFDCIIHFDEINQGERVAAFIRVYENSAFAKGKHFAKGFGSRFPPVEIKPVTNKPEFGLDLSFGVKP